MTDRVYDGNDLDEWIATFGFSAKLVTVIKEGFEATSVDELSYVYEDEELLKQVETAVNRLEYKKFLAARNKTSRIALEAPPSEPTLSSSASASTSTTTTKTNTLPVPPPSAIPTPAPPAPPTGPSTIDREIIRKQQELLEIQRRLQEEKEKHLRAEEKTKALTKKRRKIAELEERIRRAASIDVAILLDCTGSMSVYLDNCKTQITEFVNQIKSMHPHISLRLAFIGYRDHCDGTDRLAVLRFTNSVEEFVEFVSRQEAKGGGDEAEDVFGGLHVVRGLDWAAETRILYHIGDAPCHGKDFHDNKGTDDYPNGDPNNLKAEDILRTLMTSKVFYYFGKIKDRTDIMIQEFNRIAVTTGLPRPATATASTISGAGRDYIAVTEMSGGTMMEVITKTVTTTFSETLSSSARIEEGGKLAKKEVILDPTMPDFSTLPMEGTLRFEMTMPASPEAMLTNLTESDEDKCISDFPDREHHFVKCSKLPFAKGEMRAAYYGQVIRGSSGAVLTGVILKESLALSSSQLTKPKYEAFLSCHRASKALALEFNRVKPLDCARIEFCDACIIQFMSRRDQPFMIEESQINDPFEKYNNNSGYCSPNPTPRGTKHDAVQAFSHWTYHVTKQRLMVVDCQGGYNASLNRFLLTDPAIHFMDVTHFGGTNMGKSGMMKFFDTHVCNDYCKELRLARP